MSLRRFRRGISPAASCSAVISAGCHQPVWDFDAHLKRVKGGVLAEETRLKLREKSPIFRSFE